MGELGVARGMGWDLSGREGDCVGDVGGADGLVGGEEELRAVGEKGWDLGGREGDCVGDKGGADGLDEGEEELRAAWEKGWVL